MARIEGDTLRLSPGEMECLARRVGQETLAGRGDNEAVILALGSLGLAGEEVRGRRFRGHWRDTRIVVEHGR